MLFGVLVLFGVLEHFGGVGAGEEIDELLLVGSFMRRPPPELAILPLDAGRIAAAHAKLSAAAFGVRVAG